jgi:beta-phosphoglucomutase
MTTSHPLTLSVIPDLNELQGRFPGVTTIFFDMDGTLFDSEKYHTEAMLKIGKDYEIRPPHGPKEIHSLMHGKADYLVFDIIKDWPGFPQEWSVRDFVDTKNRNLLEILSPLKPSDYFPDLTAALLNDIKSANLYLALVTSSEKIITHELLKMVGLDALFDLVVTRDDCPAHKPDPWPYIHAMKEAKARPEETLILEDSQVGLAAALASKAHVIKVEWFN